MRAGSGRYAGSGLWGHPETEDALHGLSRPHPFKVPSLYPTGGKSVTRSSVRQNFFDGFPTGERCFFNHSDCRTLTALASLLPA